MTDRTYTTTVAQVPAVGDVGRRISWSAVIAGAIAALVVQLLLNMLGVGVGAAFVDPATDGSPAASTMGFGAVIWWAISGIVAAFAGGLVAGSCISRALAPEGLLHGFLSWAVTTLFLVYMITSLASSTMGTLGSIAGPLAQRASETPQAEQAIRNPQQTAQDILNQAQQAAPTTPEARQTAEAAADAVSQGAIWSFIALVIGAVAAALGGRMGASMARHPYDTDASTVNRTDRTTTVR